MNAVVLLPSLESCFFMEEATWTLRVNTAQTGRGICLLRERRTVATIDAPDWSRLELLIGHSADPENLADLAQIIVGNLIGTSSQISVQVGERLTLLLMRHFQKALAHAA